MRKILNLFAKIKWVLLNFNGIKTHMIYVQTPFYITHGRNINYNSDGLVVLNNCDCLNEIRFKNAYEYSLSAEDWRMSGFDQRWRFYIVCYFANLAIKLEGDFVECGVFKGGYTLAILNYTNFETTNKTFYLMDTFDGLNEKYLNTSEKKSGLKELYNAYGNVYDFVENIFKDKPVEIIKGTVPETLPLCKVEKISFLSIDMNCVEPEIAAANYFWDKIVSGGIIVLDDYGFMAHIEQKKAFDEFANQKGISILSLPTGQGVIFKL